MKLILQDNHPTRLKARESLIYHELELYRI